VTIKSLEVTGMTGRPDRSLVLLRHAKSAWPDLPDQERPLARRGLHDAPAVGRWLRTEGYVPDLVLCSTARRAQETWQLAATELRGNPPVYWDERLYQASAAELLDLIRQAPPESSTMVVVGHDPAIAELALILAEAAAVLEFNGTWRLLGPGQAQLTRFVIPRDLVPWPPGHQ
jgi:phosphohistidine phosphatase